MTKCAYHAETDAIATCSTCGRALCKSCAVEMNGMIHCLQCARSLAPASSVQGFLYLTNRMALTSMLLGIGAWILWFVMICFNATLGAFFSIITFGGALLCLVPLLLLPYALWISSIVTGHVAIRQVKQQPHASSQSLAVVGLVLSYLALVLTVLALLCLASGAIFPSIFDAISPYLERFFPNRFDGY